MTYRSSSWHNQPMTRRGSGSAPKCSRKGQRVPGGRASPAAQTPGGHDDWPFGRWGGWPTGAPRACERERAAKKGLSLPLALSVCLPTCLPACVRTYVCQVVARGQLAARIRVYPGPGASAAAAPRPGRAHSLVGSSVRLLRAHTTLGDGEAATAACCCSRPRPPRPSSPRPAHSLLFSPPSLTVSPAGAVV